MKLYFTKCNSAYFTKLSNLYTDKIATMEASWNRFEGFFTDKVRCKYLFDFADFLLNKCFMKFDLDIYFRKLFII